MEVHKEQLKLIKRTLYSKKKGTNNMSESSSFEGYLINSFRQVVKEELESTRWHK